MAHPTRREALPSLSRQHRLMIGAGVVILLTWVGQRLREPAVCEVTAEMPQRAQPSRPCGAQAALPSDYESDDAPHSGDPR